MKPEDVKIDIIETIGSKLVLTVLRRPMCILTGRKRIPSPDIAIASYVWKKATNS